VVKSGNERMDERATERLKWRSRRGLLELDLIFTRFWEKHDCALNEHEMQALDQLLQLPDNDLLDMVMQRQICTDAKIRPLLQMLCEV
jgi:succinate dehydrogenase flavin-adding protein (antitoxin of CptAB toxin-antitoxin module)